jgi:diguanylate cyclase (GGDEF)-like protein
MSGVLIVSCAVPFAALALAARRLLHKPVMRRRRNAESQAREDAVLKAVRSLVDASRRSSGAVIEALDATVRNHDDAIDAFLAFTPSGDELACVYASGPRVEHCSRLRLRRDASEYLPARAALAGHRASGIDGVILPTDRHALAVPMRDGDGLRAVIYVSSSRSDTLAGEETIVRTIEHAVTPYSLALERETDRADATYDSLTGLLTPRAFRSRLTAEIERARVGTRAVVTLWFIDTDRFKIVNDTHGHGAGDIVLQTMSEIIRAHTVPDIDVVGRNGGDEFCALIFDAQKTVAIERAQQLCEAVRKAAFGVPVQLTASIGVASFPYDARTANELLEVADAAMYHSKRTGRDRVSFAVNGTTFSIYR